MRGASQGEWREGKVQVEETARVKALQRKEFGTLAERTDR